MMGTFRTSILPVAPIIGIGSSDKEEKAIGNKSASA